MTPMVAILGMVGVAALAAAPGPAVAQIAKNVAAKSPWGPADEIGTLNMTTDVSRLEVLKQVANGRSRPGRGPVCRDAELLWSLRGSDLPDLDDAHARPRHRQGTAVLLRRRNLDVYP